MLITFDDGYRNNLTLAAEALKQLGLPCVFFLSTGYIGTGRILWVDEIIERIRHCSLKELPLPLGGTAPLPDDPDARRAAASDVKERCKYLETGAVEEYLDRLRSITPEPPLNEELHGFMDWDDVRRLHKLGFEIGSHTVSHPILTRVAAGRLDSELAESKRHIEEQTGAACNTIAYPNGGPRDVSEAVFGAARRAGYQAGFTISGGLSSPGEDLFAVSRISVMGHVPASVLEYQASGVKVLLRSVS